MRTDSRRPSTPSDRLIHADLRQGRILHRVRPFVCGQRGNVSCEEKVNERGKQFQQYSRG